MVNRPGSKDHQDDNEPPKRDWLNALKRKFGSSPQIQEHVEDTSGRVEGTMSDSQEQSPQPTEPLKPGEDDESPYSYEFLSLDSYPEDLNNIDSLAAWVSRNFEAWVELNGSNFSDLFFEGYLNDMIAAIAEAKKIPADKINPLIGIHNLKRFPFFSIEDKQLKARPGEYAGDIVLTGDLMGERVFIVQTSYEGYTGKPDINTDNLKKALKKLIEKIDSL